MESKTKLYPGLLAALMGGMAAFLLSPLQFSVWIEPPVPETSPDSQPSSTTTSVPIDQPQSLLKPEPVPNGLRVSNQTPNAIRVILLAQHAANSRATIDAKASYREPVHWDFAPSEGSQQGLILSLPNGNLRLQKGDILTAFAVDGSRQYWGPYVVGKTAVPAQQGQPAEWHLILKP